MTGIKRPKHGTRWILCTKWGVERKDKSVDIYWSPIGDHTVHTTTGKLNGAIYNYASKDEAIEAMKDIANVFENLKGSPLVTCEVRYVPQKIKMYDKSWYDKYVLTEVKLEIVGVVRGSEEDLNP